MTGQNAKTAESLDTELGHLVVERNLATHEEVEEASKRCRDEDASNRTLADVLVAQGSVTPRQISRLKETIKASRSQQIPGYQILEKIGAGAMATVFKARQLSLDREVAIKVLPRKMSENPEYVERFNREGRAAAKLNHANIVQAIDVGEAGGYHYFVMEYVEGHTLHDELAGGKVFSEAEALDIVIQIARALDHAHSQGLIHRDVKPKNIMITSEGVAKLADMGLARAAADVRAAEAEAGRAYGTPYYISPEQVRGEVDIDFRADIYSLGATLYHLVTGRVPFEASTPVAVMHKHLREPLVPPDHVRPELSAGVGEVVEVMMSKERRRRYGSTADLLLDLEAIRSGEPPLQARKRIDSAVLNGLAVEAADEGADAVAKPGQSGRSILVALGVGLGASVLLNLVLLLLLAG
ncbi:MAG: serine/threonine protein kinase [Phycisphaerae bacterium]|nr:serine/threonine protein kinase [Phycisphaerae bacterium]